MEFQQLEMFTAVVEEGSVSRAAGRVFRTAPAVSIALKKLEEEIGTPLFDRWDRGHLKLSASGQVLYSSAKEILQRRTDTLAKLKDLRHGRAGTVRIGANESTSLYLLPKLTHAFQEAHPALKIEALCDNSDRVIRALKDGRLDLALVAILNDEPTLEKHLIMRDEIVLVTNTSHRLANKTEVGVKELRNEVLITETSKASYEEVTRAFIESKIPYSIGVANITIEGIKRMVAEGVGVGFVPLMCVLEEKARGELVTIKVNGISRERELSLLHRGDALAPAARAFLAVCLKVARESSQVKTRAQKSPARAARQETSFSGKNNAARSHR